MDFIRPKKPQDLWYAAFEGNTADLEYLLNMGLDPNCPKLHPPLTAASENAHVPSVELLINRKAEVNASDRDGNTSLMIAAEMGHINIAEVLIREKAIVNFENRESKDTAIIKACRHEKPDFVKYLLSKNARADIENKDGNFCLLEALKTKSSKLINQLIERDGCFNRSNKAGVTPLMVACGNEQMEFINRLLELKCNVDAKDNAGATALIRAATSGSLNLVKTLLKAKADTQIRDESGRTALDRAVKRYAVHELLKDASECRQNLIDAAYVGDLKKITTCLQFIDVDVNWRGITALKSAASGNSKAAAEFLLKKNADVNCSDEMGKTALLVAAKSGSFEVLKALLKNKADISKATASGETALMQSCNAKSTPCVEAMLKAKAKVNLANKLGKTALMYACKRGSLEVVDILLKAKADVGFINNAGVDAFQIAAANNHLNIVNVLLKTGFISSTAISNAAAAAIDNNDTQVFEALQEKAQEQLLIEEEVQEQLLSPNATTSNVKNILSIDRDRLSKMFSIKRDMFELLTSIGNDDSKQSNLDSVAAMGLKLLCNDRGKEALEWFEKKLDTAEDPLSKSILGALFNFCCWQLENYDLDSDEARTLEEHLNKVGLYDSIVSFYLRAELYCRSSTLELRKQAGAYALAYKLLKQNPTSENISHPKFWLERAKEILVSCPREDRSSDKKAKKKKPKPAKGVKAQWQMRKKRDKVNIPAMDKLMEYVGLATVKAMFLQIYDNFAVDKKRVAEGLQSKPLNYSARFEGKPGTGKTTVARLYGEFLSGLGVLKGAGNSKVIAAPNETLLSTKDRTIVLDKNKAIVPIADLKLKDKILGLYFAASWCGQCKTFTPVLANVYNKLKRAKKPFEIVYISADRDSVAFATYLQNMPWFAIPRNDMLHIQKLQNKFGVSGFPTLILLNPDGTVISNAGSTLLAQANAETSFPWGGSLTPKAGPPPSVKVKETTGSKLKSNGVKQLEKDLEELKENGGVLFIDEAYQLDPKGEGGKVGADILARLLTEVEDHRDSLVVALAGYQKELAELFQRNPGLPGRFPVNLQFADFSYDELLEIFQKFYIAPKGFVPYEVGDQKHVEAAIHGLVRRSKMDSFDNARAVRTLWEQIQRRQASRIHEEGSRANIRLLVRDDFLGPKIDPRHKLQSSAAWKRVNSLLGLKEVKQHIVDLAQALYLAELKEEDGQEVQRPLLNRVFLGNPGTGKTSVAKDYAEILFDLGLLSRKNVVLVGPNDFTGSAIGQAGEITRGILKSAEGGVLIIDEAYGLYEGSESGGETSNPYKQVVIDALVAGVKDYWDDRAVFLLGYKEEMDKMIRVANKGLARRFQYPSDCLEFHDYDDLTLAQILVFKARKMGFRVSGRLAADVVEKVLAGQRASENNFGNAGNVQSLLYQASKRMAVRAKELSEQEQISQKTLILEDFVGEISEEKDPESFFADFIGLEKVIHQLKQIKVTKSLGRKIPFCWLFLGNPGTGKTEVGKMMAKMLHQLKVIPTDKFTHIMPSEMQTGFVGQANAKVKELYQRAKGGVLLIDEAHNLDSTNSASFMHDVVAAMVKFFTDDEFQDKIVFVLAGYPSEMAAMLRNVDQGFARRFMENRIEFNDYDNTTSCQIMELKMAKQDMEFTKEALDALPDLMNQLRMAPRWANGGDITTWTKKVFQSYCDRTTAQSGAPVDGVSSILVDVADLKASLEEMLKSKKMLETPPINNLTPQPDFPALFQNANAKPPPKRIQTTTTTTATIEEIESEGEEENKHETEEKKDDQGGTDEQEKRLRRLGALMGLGQEQIRGRIKALNGALGEDDELSTTAKDEEERLKEEASRIAGKSERAEALALLQRLEEERRMAHEAWLRAEAEKERLRLEEEARLRAAEEAARRARDAEAARAAAAQRVAAQKRAALEARRQEQLKHIGRCCMNFRWIHQGNGFYRCAGGSHTHKF